jgi:hypothetical protein
VTTTRSGRRRSASESFPSSPTNRVYQPVAPNGHSRPRQFVYVCVVPTEAEVSLREVTRETMRGICDLDVRPDQRKYVAPNVFSIAQAYFEPRAWFRGIYAGETPVGFVMMHEDPEKGAYFLWRLMIAREHQGKGVRATGARSGRRGDPRTPGRQRNPVKLRRGCQRPRWLLSRVRLRRNRRGRARRSCHPPPVVTGVCGVASFAAPGYPQTAHSAVEMLIIEFPQSASFSCVRTLAPRLHRP